MKTQKLIIGITAPQSIILLEGQLKYFVQKGYKVYLMAPKEERTINFCDREGATLLPISINRDINLLMDLYTLFQIIRIFIKIKPDIVNLGTPKVSLLGLIAAKLLTIKKRIYTCRGFRFEHETGVKRRLLILMEQITAYCANEIICISQSVKDLGIKYNMMHTDSIVIHKGSSNGIDLDLFNRDSISSLKLKELENKFNPDNKFVFGFLGRIVERKGFKELIEAFDKIYQTHQNIKLLVVGRPYYDQIDEETIDIAYSHPGIEMVGLVDYTDTPYYYSLMDVFVLPAYWEGFGNVLIQAAALGLPIITTDATGCKDAVSNGYNSQLIPPKDTNALYDSMLEFYQNEKMRLKFSKNGLEWAKNFKSEKIWEGIDELYKKQ